MSSQADEINEVFSPLADFDALRHWDHLRAEAIDPSQMPQPYQRLLVHDVDMTGTLERHFAQPMKLRVLSQRIDDDTLLREVLLIGERDDRIAEFGAIRIELGLFNPSTRQKIEAGHRPLGGILREDGITYQSRPSAFLRLLPDEALCSVIGVEPASVLFGRRNTLAMPDGAVMARIIEILPRLQEPLS